MSNILEDKLKVLANDKITLDAIRFVADKILEEMKPNVEKLEANDVIGSKYRAYVMAREMVKYMFQDIEARKENRTETDNINKGK